ncbi:MAG: hypothetical protein JW839_14505 [Candidatus Lokiarchaeota archaeon]|nr:hypothetical protein [Candidatus Lokiarchaeota archaeon]
MLHREKALVHVGFYRHDEALSDITKDQIISGIYSIVPEIFRDHVLKRLNIAKYTILFNGFEIKRGEAPGRSTPAVPAAPARRVDPDGVVLAYAIVDLMSDHLDKVFLKAVQEKIKRLGDVFVAMVGNEEGIESMDFEPFKQKIVGEFKDMLKKPEDRFDDMWPARPVKAKKRK